MDKVKEQQLIENHWDWLEPILIPHFTPVELATMKYLYITAMLHGIKHGEELEKEVKG